MSNIPYTVKVEDKVEFSGQTWEKKVVLSGHVKNVFEFFKTNTDLKMTRPANVKETSRVLTAKEQDDFAGGKLTDLYKTIDLSLVEKNKDKLFKDFGGKFIQFATKKRVRSEHDGEWDFDRRFDITPFSKRENSSIKRKSITLNVELSFSCRIDVQTINEYGAFVVNFINFLEKSGVTVAVNFTRTGVGAANGFSSYVDRTELVVKTADEYVSKEDLMRCFNSIYFRRIGFAEIILAAESVNADACAWLGSPFAFGKNFEYNPETGVLNLYSCASYESQKDVVSLMEKELVV